jgi:hypothetical protein
MSTNVRISLVLGLTLLLLLLSIPDLPALALIRWTWVLARLHFFMRKQFVDEASGWEIFVRPHNQKIIMARLSLILTMKTTLLVALLLVYQPIVVTAASAAVFNEAACVRCVGSIADWVDTTNVTNKINNSNDDNIKNFNNGINGGNGGSYCDQGGDEYVCLTDGTTASSGSSSTTSTCYHDEFTCTGVLDDVVGIAKTAVTIIAVLACCCCAAIVAGIAGCIYCCVKGNAPLPAGVPGAYQTNPALLQQQQQSVAPKPALHLPGTLQMAPVTANTTPAQTGLATAYQPNYQPNYQTQSQTNIPFAEALSVVENDGTTKRY